MPGPKVHRRLTGEWAIDEGMSAEDASAVAAADAAVDVLWPGSRHPARHFGVTAALVYAPRYLRAALRALQEADPAAEGTNGEARSRALERLGWALHCRQDGIGHGALGLSHLRWDVGLLKRNPDDWDLMPEATRSAIERATRQMVRRFLAVASAAPGSGYNL